jgi:hypothetical protein
MHNRWTCSVACTGNWTTLVGCLSDGAMLTRLYVLFQDWDFHGKLRKYKTHNDDYICVVHFHM